MSNPNQKIQSFGPKPELNSIIEEIEEVTRDGIWKVDKISHAMTESKNEKHFYQDLYVYTAIVIFEKVNWK